MNIAPLSPSNKPSVVEKFNALAYQFEDCYGDLYQIFFAVEIGRNHQAVIDEKELAITKNALSLLRQQFRQMYLEARILLLEVAQEAKHQLNWRPLLDQLKVLTSLLSSIVAFVMKDASTHKVDKTDAQLVHLIKRLNFQSCYEAGYLHDTLVSAFETVASLQQQYRYAYSIQEKTDAFYSTDLKNRWLDVLNEPCEWSQDLHEVNRLRDTRIVEQFISGWIQCFTQDLEHDFASGYPLMVEKASKLPNSHVYCFLLDYLKYVKIDTIENFRCAHYPLDQLIQTIRRGYLGIGVLGANSTKHFRVGVPLLQSFFEYLSGLLVFGADRDIPQLKEWIDATQASLKVLYSTSVVMAENASKKRGVIIDQTRVKTVEINHEMTYNAPLDNNTDTNPMSHTPDYYVYPRDDSTCLSAFEFALRILKGKTHKEFLAIDDARTQRGELIQYYTAKIQATLHKPWQDDLIEAERGFDEALFILACVKNNTAAGLELYHSTLDVIRNPVNVRNQGFQIPQALFFYMRLIGDIYYCRKLRSEYVSKAVTDDTLLVHAIHILRTIDTYVTDCRLSVDSPVGPIKKEYFDNLRRGADVFLKDIADHPKQSACEQVSILLMHELVDELIKFRELFTKKMKSLSNAKPESIVMAEFLNMKNRRDSLNAVIERLNLSRHPAERKALSEDLPRFQKKEELRQIHMLSRVALGSGSSGTPRLLVNELLHRFSQQTTHFHKVICLAFAAHNTNYMTPKYLEMYRWTEALSLLGIEQGYIDSALLSSRLHHLGGIDPDFDSCADHISMLNHLYSVVRTYHLIFSGHSATEADTEDLDSIRILKVKELADNGYFTQAVLNVFILGFCLQLDCHEDMSAKKRLETVHDITKNIVDMNDQEAALIADKGYTEFAQLRGQYLVEYYILYRYYCALHTVPATLVVWEKSVRERISSLYNAKIYRFLLDYLDSLHIQNTLTPDGKTTQTLGLEGEDVLRLTQMGIEAIDDFIFNAKNGVMPSLPIIRRFTEYYKMIFINLEFQEDAKAALTRLYKFLKNEVKSIKAQYESVTVAPNKPVRTEEERAKSFAQTSKPNPTPQKQNRTKKKQPTVSPKKEEAPTEPRVFDTYGTVRAFFKNDKSKLLSFYQSKNQGNVSSRAHALLGLLETHLTFSKGTTRKILLPLIRTYQNEIQNSNRFKQSEANEYEKCEARFKECYCQYVIQYSETPPVVSVTLSREVTKVQRSKAKMNILEVVTSRVTCTHESKMVVRVSKVEETDPVVTVRPATRQEELIRVGLESEHIYDMGELPVVFSDQELRVIEYLSQFPHLTLMLQGGTVTDLLFNKVYPRARIKPRDHDWLIVGIDDAGLHDLMERFNQWQGKSGKPTIEGSRRNAKAGIVLTFSNKLPHGEYEEIEMAGTRDLRALAQGFGSNCVVYYDIRRKLCYAPFVSLPAWLKKPELCATTQELTMPLLLTTLYKFVRYQHFHIPMSIEKELWIKVSKCDGRLSESTIHIKWFDKFFLQQFPEKSLSVFLESKLLALLFPNANNSPDMIEDLCKKINEFMGIKTFMTLTKHDTQRVRAFVFAKLMFEPFMNSRPPINGSDDVFRRHLTHFLKAYPFCTYDFFTELCDLLKSMIKVSIQAPSDEADFWLMGIRKAVVVPAHPYEFQPQRRKTAKISQEGQGFQPGFFITVGMGPPTEPLEPLAVAKRSEKIAPDTSRPLDAQKDCTLK